MSTEDLDYNFDSSVMANDTAKDVDHNNKSILVRHLKDLDRLISVHNTFDAIDNSSKLSAEQQIAAHRLLVTYLRSFRDDLASKVEELNNGR